MMHAFIPGLGRHRQVDLSVKSAWLIYRVNCNQPACQPTKQPTKQTTPTKEETTGRLGEPTLSQKYPGGTGLLLQLLVTEDRKFKGILVYKARSRPAQVN